MSVDKSAECRQNAENDLPGSSLCQNGKQVEIITKMIFELCYIEAIFQNSRTLKTELLETPYSFFHISMTRCRARKMLALYTAQVVMT